MDEKLVEDILRKVMAGLGSAEEVTATTTAAETVDTTIPVELSARHVHLSQEHVDELFGGSLNYKKELSQPGQYLCEERVRLIGPKGVIDNVAVLGPVRSKSQVEISLTEARTLGLKVPVRQSGDTEGTPGIVLASTTGLVGLEEGVIVAGRHIHMTPEDGRRLGVKDMEMVSVHMNSTRPAILEDVLVRTNDNFRLAMHIDFDEGNGIGWGRDASCKIVKESKKVGVEL